jgi:hypothetical protein
VSRKLKLLHATRPARRLNPRATLLFLLFLAGIAPCLGRLSAADFTGLQLLRSLSPGLDGSGIQVAQAEGVELENTTRWQPNPDFARTGTAFTYTSSNGTATIFPNSVGIESGHANSVASLFYGSASGFAPGAAGVDCYEADFFYESIIGPQTAIPARIVNQSFIFSTTVATEQAFINRNYDDYSDKFNVLFVSGIGNGGSTYSPATAYNGLGVAAFGGSSSIGPTVDNARSKPDITAPAGATSFSTPQVAGAAALLLQAALRGDGRDTNAADMRVLKALLLNGAVKPVDWTAPTNQPLDTRYGAGILNVFNSWNQLLGGRTFPGETTAVPTGTSHPPGQSTATHTNRVGWTFSSITNTAAQDAIQHHYVDLPPGPNSYGATITLVWNMQSGRTALNDLDLYLVKTGSEAILGQSTTFVNNVEHLHLAAVPPGRYDLQVVKNGGNPGSGRVSPEETYSLVFEFYAQQLEISATDQSVAVSWPLAPDGFVLEESSGLPAVWTTVAHPSVPVGNRNVVTMVSTNAQQIYRLRRP